MKIRILVMVLAAVMLLAPSAGAQEYVTIEYSGFAVDSLDGVEALYDLAGGYQCSEFVTRYYLENYGVQVDYCWDGPVSLTQGYEFLPCEGEPQRGDVAYIPAYNRGKSYGHWAVVRDCMGSTAVLIEQNWRYGSQAVYRREIDVYADGYIFYHLVGPDGKSQPSAWAEFALDEALELGIAENLAGDYRENVSRGEFLALLGRALEALDEEYGWLAQYSQDMDVPLTRQETAVLLCGVLRMSGWDDCITRSCRDMDQVDDWARESVGLMLELGLMSTDLRDNFEPQSPVEVQHAVAIAVALYNYLRTSVNTLVLC